MKLPFVFTSLRAVVRELRGIRGEAKRIADAVERAWPSQEYSATPSEDEDIIGPQDHGPDEKKLKQKVLAALAQGDESLAEELMSRFDE